MLGSLRTSWIRTALAAGLAAGCARPTGKTVSGMNADGSLTCTSDFVTKAAVAGIAAQQCPNGQVVTGMNTDGSQKCGRAASGGGLRTSYDFEEGSGTSVADVTGGGNTLTLSPSGASWTTSGHAGKALNFDGSSGYASATATGTLDFAEYASLEAWVFIPAAVNAAMTVVARDGAYRLGVVNMNVQAGFDTAASPTSSVWVGAGPVQTGVWTHIAATYDGVSVRTFVGGRQSSETAWAYGPVKASIKDLTIGSRGAADYFTGKIDEVRTSATAVRFAGVQRGNLVCGLTAASTGNLGGWAAAGTFCQTTCKSTTAHLCTSHEILRSYQSGASLPSGGAWIASANAVASVTGGTGAAFTQGSVSGSSTYMTNYRGCCNWDTSVYAVNGVTLSSVTMPSAVASTTLTNCTGWTGAGFGQTATATDLAIAACTTSLPAACCD